MTIDSMLDIGRLEQQRRIRRRTTPKAFIKLVQPEIERGGEGGGGGMEGKRMYKYLPD